MTVIASILSVIMALFVTTLRMKRANQPTSFKKIILPPLFMSTGFAMFLYPPMRVHLLYGVESLLTGMILSIPLILTSKFEVKENGIFMKRSKAFLFILLGLLVLRTVMKFYVGEQISFYETGAIFYILAIGMIFPWRIAMLFKYKQLVKTTQES